MSAPTLPADTVGVRDMPLERGGDGPAPLFAVIGAHRWAGTSTLAAMWAPAADAGMCWPAHPRDTPLAVIVARESVRGLRAAARVLQDPATGRAPGDAVIAGLVVVAARPGRVRKDVAAKRDSLTDLLDGNPIWRIPWIDALLTDPVSVAAWAPGDVVARRGPIDQVVPRQVAAVGSAICTHLSGWQPAPAPQAAPEVDDVDPGEDVDANHREDRDATRAPLANGFGIAPLPIGASSSVRVHRSTGPDRFGVTSFQLDPISSTQGVPQ